MGAEALKNALNSILQGWLIDHPVLGWCAIHPLWAIALVFLLVFLAWGLLKAIARLVETVWLALLQSPIRFSRWALKQVMGQFISAIPVIPAKIEADPADDPGLPLTRTVPQIGPFQADQPDPASQAAQLSSIVVRLEQLQKEQLQLLQDVQALLPPLATHQTDHSAVNPPQSTFIPNQTSELVDRS